MEYTVHLQGYLEENYDGEISFKDRYNSLAEDITYELKDYEPSKDQPEDDYQTNTSAYLPRVALRMYFSEKEIDLEEVTEKVVLDTMGALDIYTEWYGYSEWTIEGFNVINFTIGNHNLDEILRSYLGKYVHIVLEVLEEG